MLQIYDERNRNLVVNIAGELVHRDRAAVSPFDSSVQNGDAVWEGLRLYRGRIFRLNQHLARFRKSAAMLQYEGFPEDREIIQELSRTLAANDMTDGVHIRLTMTRGVKYTSGLDPRINRSGCTLIVLAEHKQPVYDREGITLVTARQRRPFADVLDQHIHSSNQLTSILAKLEANAAGFDDALMLDTAGYLAETNATHLFLVEGGRVATPTTKACPEGITRSAVLELCRAHEIACVEEDISPERAHAADEVFCSGTMGELIAVRQIDQTLINGGLPGPMTTRITELFQTLLQTESESVRVV